MKKKLEADLISIAHRILKLKNKEDLAQLHLETQKLYEKLSVLKFVEENFSDVKPTIGNANIQEVVIAALEKEPKVEEVEVAVATEEIEIQPELVEEIEEEVEEEVEEDDFSDEEEEETEDEYSDEEEETEDEEKTEELEDEEEESEEDSEEEEETEEEEFDEEESEENEDESEEEEREFEPHFELFNVEEVEDKKTKTEAKQISFEDLLGSGAEPVFERVFDPIQEEVEEESVDDEETEEETVFNPGFEMELSEEMEEEEKPIPNFEFDKEISINEAFAKTITFGLNDRIAFEKQLFAGSSEDLNRVVSQLSTFDSFEEAQNFIEDMVKPDYDNWEGKEEYVTRFMEIIEKKFA